MRDLAEARQHPLEAIVRQEQWIAAGEEHIADHRRARDVVDRALPLRGAELVLAVLVADDARARAVPAVHRTRARDEEQHAVGIAVHQSRNRAVVVFAQRVDLLVGRAHELLVHHHHRAAERLRGVIPVEQARVVRRDAVRQAVAAALQGASLVVREVEHPLERLEPTNGMTELPSPVVPFLVGGVRKGRPTKGSCARASRGSCDAVCPVDGRTGVQHCEAREGVYDGDGRIRSPLSSYELSTSRFPIDPTLLDESRCRN